MEADFPPLEHTVHRPDTNSAPVELVPDPTVAPNDLGGNSPMEGPKPSTRKRRPPQWHKDFIMTN
jgi:hypothetical protein